MNLYRLFSLIVLGISVTSCSSQQLYSAGRAYQSNECMKLQDDQERERCMRDANMSYHDYRRDTGAESE